MNKNILTSLLVSLSLLVGCGTGIQASTPTKINEPTIGDVIEESRHETVDINNCDGLNPNYELSYALSQSEITTFEVTVGAGGLLEGSPIPEVLSVQLNAEINSALKKQIGTDTVKTHKFFVENPNGTYLRHEITWKIQKITGFAEVIYGSEKAQVAFARIISIEPSNRTSSPLSCEGAPDSDILPEISATLTLTPMPTYTPTSTFTPSPHFPNCPDRGSRGEVIFVTQEGTKVVATNIAEFPVTIRISWDNQDPGGIGAGDDSEISPTWVTKNNTFSNDIKNHTSAQVWAWDTPGKCVDSYSLDIK